MNPLSVSCMLALLFPSADPVVQDSKLVEAWLKVSLKHAQDYTIHPDGKPETPLTMLPQAVFRHSQPVRGDDIGAVYLWVDAENRPAVIGTTFAYTEKEDRRWVVHEFHSLASTPLHVTWRGQVPWEPAGPGLTWKAVPDARSAASDPATRQRQARDIARRFTATSVDHKDSPWELRLLAKPIHQFDVEKPDTVSGGALFVFCQGTDPELILAVEAQKDDDKYVWKYAAASFTDYALKLRLDDKEVWTCEKYSGGRTKAHWNRTTGAEKLP